MRVAEIIRTYHPRLRVITCILLINLAVLSLGLAYRQLYLYSEYAEREERQNLRRIIVPGPRGNIYDRDGRLLVGNRPRYSAVVFLNELRPEFREEFKRLRRVYEEDEEREPPSSYYIQIEARSNVVQRYIDLVETAIGRRPEVDSKAIEKHFGQQLLLPFPLIQDMHPHEYALLLEQIPVHSPIQIYTSNARYYPYGSLANHLIGYVGTTEELQEKDLPGSDLVTFKARNYEGRTGIEKAFDRHLSGESGLQIWVVDPSGFQYEPKTLTNPVQGKDVRITIDAELQDIAEIGLGNQVGAIVALDVKRGDLLVMASKPSYDLNDLSPFIPVSVAQDIFDRGAWSNRALQGLYAPGSTFKLITAMAGLRKGILDQNSRTYCGGGYSLGSHLFQCWKEAGHGTVGFHEAISMSCNVFFFHFSQKIGVDQISAEARLFSLHEPTGIDLPYETDKMIIPTREWKTKNRNERWYPGNTAHLAIGQGYVRITPLQMACFTAALARGETKFVPTVLYDPFRQAKPSRNDLNLGDVNYQLILDAMEATANSGTASLIKVPGVRIAAKTGTSEVQTPAGAVHLAWTICFAPINDPEIAVAVVVEGQVPGMFHGGDTAVPIAQPILKRFFEKVGHGRIRL